MRHLFSNPWHDVFDAARIGMAAVALPLLGYLLNLAVFRRGNVRRFAPRALRRVFASITATAMVIFTCLFDLGDGVHPQLPLGMIYLYFAITGYRVTAPFERAVSEDALREAHEVMDD